MLAVTQDLIVASFLRKLSPAVLGILVSYAKKQAHPADKAAAPWLADCLPSDCVYTRPHSASEAPFADLDLTQRRERPAPP